MPAVLSNARIANTLMLTSVTHALMDTLQLVEPVSQHALNSNAYNAVLLIKINAPAVFQDIMLIKNQHNVSNALLLLVVLSVLLINPISVLNVLLDSSSILILHVLHAHYSVLPVHRLLLAPP